MILDAAPSICEISKHFKIHTFRMESHGKFQNETKEKGESIFPRPIYRIILKYKSFKSIWMVTSKD